jgi:type I restriction enzyme S subunit
MPDDAERTLTPKLRFREFHEPWHKVLLQDVTVECTARNVTDFSPKPIMGVTKVEGIIPMEERLIGSDTARYKLVRKNWFAYNPMRLNIGSIARWQGDIDILVSPDYVVFRCLGHGTSAVAPDYLDHFRRSRQWEDFVTESGIGSVRVRIYFKDIGRLSVSLPSLAEQQKIADCLTSLDELIAAQGRKVQALKAHRKGLMQQLFPREGETLPRLRFPEFRDAPEWEIRTLRSVCERIMDGTHFSPRTKSGPRPYLTSKNIRDGWIDLSTASYISEEEHREIYARCPVRKLDVLLTKDGANTGNRAINTLDFEFSLLSSVAVLRGVASLLSQRFLYQSIASDSLQATILNSMSGQAITRITLEKLGNYTIPLPGFTEQQRIADCLFSLDARIAAESEKFVTIKTQKKGLMQQLFPAAGISQALSAEHDINQHGAHLVNVSVATTPEVGEPAAVSSRKPYKVGFARQLLAAEILQHCHKQPTMGRVKLQKLIHLCEYYAELDDIHGSYVRAAAGPFDNKLMRGVANGLERQKWFKQVRSENRASYEPMESCGQHSKYLQRWSEQLPKIREIIQYFAKAKTLSCEIASTLYAAWNDLLIDGRHPTDEEIIREASDPKRWHESKANIEKIKWPTALKWMRERGLVPRGYGAHTTKKAE